MSQFRQYFTQLHGINSLFDYSIYWYIATAVYAGVLYREAQIRARQAGDLALRTAQLEGLLVKSQLETLKARLQPHFLFNTLNSISSCFRTGENELGLSLLVKLSDLLRHALNQGERRMHPLRAELTFIDLYLDIEAVRFEDRLRIERDFQAEALPVPVPVMILQPIVENAIRHGVSQSLGPALLRLHGVVQAQQLVFAVYNDGPLLEESRMDDGREGIGLRNTVERLEHEYGNKAFFQIENWEARGVVATITLPMTKGEEGADG
nr:histidine kinase [Acanthopleuribacter pedis]